MSILGDRLRELRGAQSQREMAEPLGIAYQAWDRYEKGQVSPSADKLQQICRIHAVSANWLLGLPERNNSPRTVVNGDHAMIAGRDINAGGVCSKCKLMKAHLREITGRA